MLPTGHAALRQLAAPPRFLPSLIVARPELTLAQAPQEIPGIRAIPAPLATPAQTEVMATTVRTAATALVVAQQIIPLRITQPPIIQPLIHQLSRLQISMTPFSI